MTDTATDNGRASDGDAHPLEGCDPDDCYKTMMSERTELTKARREAEDNLVKTIVQITSTLIVLISGFLVQTNVVIERSLIVFLAAAVILLIISLVSGLIENLFSSAAYKAQLELVEKFYTRQIADFAEPKANWWVRACQIASFTAFALALMMLGIFAVKEAGVKSRVKSTIATAATPAATAATPAAAAAAAAAAATPAAAAAAATATADSSRRGPGVRGGNQVSRTDHATSTAQKGQLDR